MLFERRLLPLALVALLASAACDTQGETVQIEENDPVEDAHPLPTGPRPACAANFRVVANPRIVLGEGIDGVRMYDRPADVVGKLGERDFRTIPDWCLVADGYAYGITDVFADLGIFFFHRMNGDSSGVGWMQAGYSYPGTTKDGIGIGSSRADVECLYGPSQQERALEVVSDSIHHIFEFEADTVAFIQFFTRSAPSC